MSKAKASPTSAAVSEQASIGPGANSPNGKVYSYRVKAGELSFDGDALEEIGYLGKRLVLK